MGEIDRVQPILRPVMPSRAAERIQQGSDRHRHPHERENDDPPANEQEELEEAVESPAPAESEHRLDLSI